MPMAALYSDSAGARNFAITYYTRQQFYSSLYVCCTYIKSIKSNHMFLFTCVCGFGFDHKAALCIVRSAVVDWSIEEEDRPFHCMNRIRFRDGVDEPSNHPNSNDRKR